MTNSAINIPTSVAGMVQIISGDDYYIYISPSSTTGDGSSSSPYPTLSDAFNKIENSRIARDVNVYMVVQSSSGATGWNAQMVDDSMITVRHPDADRITIKGESPTTITPYAVNYYDSTLRAMGDGVVGAATGGYLMELTVPSTSVNNIEIGDFVSITDSNYSSTSSYVTGLSGPTFLETDFAHYSSGNTQGYDSSGHTYQASPLSLRKTLMLGCHEIVGKDMTNTAGVDSQNLLLHVRHTNPTHSLNHIDGDRLTGASAGYVTPQGLVFNSDGNFYTTEKNPTSAGKTAGFIHGNEYQGATAHRLSNEVWPNAVAGGLPISTGGEGTGFTAGATGSYGGWTAGFFSDTQYTQSSLSGSTYGGVSGGNGYCWDLSPTFADALTGKQFSGITIKHIPSRVYFGSSSGLKIMGGSQLGKIQDVVFCGPLFAVGSNTTLLSNGYHGIHADGGALLATSNFSVVGFDQGFRAEDNALIDCKSSVASNCRAGFVSDQNSQMRANNSIASGCFTGFYALNQSHIDSDYSISVANGGDGYYCANNSSINANASLSCLNGGYGYSAVDSSTLRLTKQTSVRDEYSETLKGGTGEVYRYGFSDKSGAFGFRNTKSGVFAESSTVYGANTRMSYNQESGYLCDRQSYLDAPYSNAWFNGFTGESQTTAYAWQSSGYAAVNQSNLHVNGSVSKHNQQDGFYVIDGSYAHLSGSTADRNGINAFRAIYDSTILSDNSSHGNTASGISWDGMPSGVAQGYGYNAVNDSKIFVGSAGGHFQGAGTNGITQADTNSAIRYY